MTPTFGNAEAQVVSHSVKSDWGIAVSSSVPHTETDKRCLGS